MKEWKNEKMKKKGKKRKGTSLTLIRKCGVTVRNSGDGQMLLSARQAQTRDCSQQWSPCRSHDRETQAPQRARRDNNTRTLASARSSQPSSRGADHVCWHCPEVPRGLGPIQAPPTHSIHAVQVRWPENRKATRNEETVEWMMRVTTLMCIIVTRIGAGHRGAAASQPTKSC